MAVQGVGGSNPNAMTFMQANRQAQRVGSQATARLMYESLPQDSVNGSGTKLGKGEFSKSSEEMRSIAVDAISSIMEQDDDVTNISNLGNESLLGPTDFSEMNDRSYNARQQVAASAYNYFNN